MNNETEILFHQLVDLSPAEREVYFLEQAVSPDARAEVEALLRFDSGSDHILTECVSSVAARLQTSAAPKKDDRCGPYRLGRVLGHGGMGSVYLAQRADGEVDQQVAIKLLRYGCDESAFRDRFLRERQILASLNHPGIARLLDAGHTSDGQPFLVMDYVDGSPIDAYAQRLDPREKVTLFIQVCDAVSYAHRNLIVHRDLKPSNILIDSSGRVKLLDFGIAKFLDVSQEQTQTRERLLTPDYASPEQVRGGAQTTATDVYSLGAVLYKLLTGKSPHALASGTQESVELAICSLEPVAPCRLNSEVPKDLDFIVGRALRKEPEERYASVDDFAADLRAFLEWRPVRARSGNAWYRTRKFVRRYRLAVAAAALVVASLSTGLYVANRQRAIAQRRFQQVRQLANKVLGLDAVIRVLPGSTQAREEIMAMSQDYLDGLGADARTDQSLALEVADAYLILARAQGVPTLPNLGRYAQAEVNLRKADDLLEVVLKVVPRDRKALLLSAEVAHDRMILANTDHRNEEALTEARKAAARLDTLLNLGPASPPERGTAATLFSNIALAHKNLRLYDDAVRYARRAIETARSSPSAGTRYGDGLSIIADSLRYSGDLEGALQAILEARASVEKADFRGETERRSSLFNVLWREGVILGQDDSISMQRPAEAIAVLEKAFGLTEEWAQKDPHEASSRILLASAARELGKILRHRDPQKALAVYDQALLRIREVNNNTKARRAESLLLAGSSYALRALRRPAEAKERIDDAFSLLRETKDYPTDRIDPDNEADAALRALGDHLAETGQPLRAAAVYQELLDKIMAFKPDPQNDLRPATKLSLTYEALAALDRLNGRIDDAAALEARRIEIWRHWQSKLPNNPYVLQQIAAAVPH
ncbi:MAG: serine/threonine protein kinase [Bryobacterales bacterium]|jgi:tetratricopeptide (TPR) repeat protein/predicted Ser/Thr protein kinase|nr:serine/threonine protein kinase [Bryobacterales bacterium]